MTVAERLNRMMAAKGYRAIDLAEMSGKTRQYVGRLCSGEFKNPGVETLRPIVEAMGGTMAEFFQGEEK